MWLPVTIGGGEHNDGPVPTIYGRRGWHPDEDEEGVGVGSQPVDQH